MYKIAWHEIGIRKNWQGRFQGRVDLHFHSRYSDGSKKMTFQEIGRIAHYYNVNAVALTDHDTIAGLKEFIAACQHYSLPVLSGVEISTASASLPEFHTLSYGFDPENPALQAALSDIQQGLVERFKNMVGWVNKTLGETAITAEETEAIIHAESGGTFGRPHLARLLLDQGYFPDKETESDRAGAPAFRFLKPVSALFPAPTIAVEKVFDLIHSAGGLAFMAHPFGHERSPKEIALSRGEDPKDLINQLLSNYPYDGIEVAHSEHRPEETDYLQALARRKGLLISGGSDTHWKEGDTRIFGISPGKALLLQDWMKERWIR